MSVKFLVASHTAPHMATLDGVAIKGVGPGPLMAALTDPRAASVVFLPTSTNSDGSPGGMLPFSAATAGTVS
jgi:hypothetical protein